MQLFLISGNGLADAIPLLIVPQCLGFVIFCRKASPVCGERLTFKSLVAYNIESHNQEYYFLTEQIRGMGLKESEFTCLIKPHVT